MVQSTIAESVVHVSTPAPIIRPRKSGILMRFGRMRGVVKRVRSARLNRGSCWAAIGCPVNGQAPRAGLYTSNVRSGVQGDQNKRDVVIGQYAGIVALYGVSVAGVAGCSNGVHRLARSGTDRHCASRRYITYFERRRRFVAMNGAARTPIYARRSPKRGTLQSNACRRPSSTLGVRPKRTFPSRSKWPAASPKRLQEFATSPTTAPENEAR